jgi:hypothetical protein
MVNKTFDNLAEVKRQIKLAEKRLTENKQWHVQRHLDRALYHLDAYAKQKEETADESRS